MAIIDIIKYEGSGDSLIWKHPREDFNTDAQLIVHEAQEAIFFYGGQIMDVFSAGTFTLTTENIPIARKVLGLATGGVSPFHCEVYFVDKAEQMPVKWGTDSRVQYMEPTYNFPISIGASGEMSLRVLDGKKLLLTLVGAGAGLGQEELTGFFRAFLMTKIKPYIAQTMKNKGISIFEVDMHLEEFSKELQVRLENDFADYGVGLGRFFVTTISKPDGEAQYEKFKEMHFRQYADVAEANLRSKVSVIDQQAQAQKTVIEAESVAQKRKIEGYSYQQERGFDVAEKMAQNEGVGEVANLGIGLSVAAGAGGVLAGALGQSVAGALNGAPAAQANSFCENCGVKLEEKARFCAACGHEAAPRQACKKCGAALGSGAKFCPQCGEKADG